MIYGGGGARIRGQRMQTGEWMGGTLIIMCLTADKVEIRGMQWGVSWVIVLLLQIFQLTIFGILISSNNKCLYSLSSYLTTLPVLH